MKITTELITPDRACGILDRHDRWVEANNQEPANRRMQPAVVARYGRDMTAGKWKLNGATIVVCPNGRLLDGQHRLTACVTSGVPFMSAITMDATEDVMPTIDTGFKRTVGNMLTLQGFPSGNHVAAVATNLWRHDRGGPGSTQPSPTASEVIDVAHEHAEEIKGGLTSARSVSDMLTLSMGAYVWILFSRKDQAAAEKFFRDLSVGAGLKENDPVLLLRERLKANRSAKAKLPPRDLYAIIFKAWNKRRAGKGATLIRWRDKAESFPEVQ